MAILFKQLRSHLESLGDRAVKELTLLAIIDDQERRKRVKPWKAKSVVKVKVKKVRVKKEKKPRKRKVKGGEGG